MTGVVLDYALSTPPSTKWLMCYGQALLAGDSTTATLRAKLIADGFPHGQDVSGNPRVPDARGRTTAGKDNMGGAAANRLTSGGSGVAGATLGAAGGAETHTLSVAQMPAHAHTGSANNAGAHSHTEVGIAYGSSGFVGSGENGNGIAYQNTGNAPDHSHTLTIANQGGGGSHNNTQPTLVLNKIIRL